MYQNCKEERVEKYARITEGYLRRMFAPYKINVEHDDNLRDDAQFFYFGHDEIENKALYIYVGAQAGCNLTNKQHLLDHYLSGVLCIKSEDFYNHSSESDNEVVALMNPDKLNEKGYLFFGDDLCTFRDIANKIYYKLLGV